jgi:hypothetical protein
MKAASPRTSSSGDAAPAIPPATPNFWCAHAGAALLAIAAVAWLFFSGERLIHRLSATIDEPGHLGAGISYWRNGDFSISTGNFFLTQLWAAWPLARTAVPFPDRAQQQQLDRNANRIGAAFLTGGKTQPDALLAPARRMTLLLCLATAGLVACWAGRLAGPLAGGLALLLYATSPVVLANAVVVTTDTGAALFFLLALAAYARLLQRPTIVSAAATGVALAALILTKFSLPGWILGAALLLGWHVFRESATTLRTLWRPHLFAALTTAFAIWLFFAVFQSNPSPGSSRWLPLPLWRELAVTRDMLDPRPGYLFGEFKAGGHLLYFPVAFVTKSTIALLLALVAFLFARPPGRATPAASRGASFAPILAGAAGYSIAAVASGLNIGVRHVLPLFALGAIVGGVALADLFRRRGKWRVAAVALAALAAVEGFSAREKPQAWFNMLAGDPARNYRIMVDSSLEWGGDLVDLVAWQQSLPAADRALPVYVSLLAPPIHGAYGLGADDLAAAFYFGRVRPGYFVFSATRLMGGAGLSYGQWNAETEQLWRRVGAPNWHAPLPDARAELAVSRLAASCRLRSPDQQIGAIYFIYRLDEAALAECLGR